MGRGFSLGARCSCYSPTPAASVVRSRQTPDAPYVGADFPCGLLNRFYDPLQNLPDLRGRAAARVSPSFLSSLAVGHPVEPLRVRAGYLWGGTRRGHKVVDGCQPCFALDIVIDDPEILEMRVAV